jgi:hypothetical protein
MPEVNFAFWSFSEVRGQLTKSLHELVHLGDATSLTSGVRCRAHIRGEADYPCFRLPRPRRKP